MLTPAAPAHRLVRPPRTFAAAVWLLAALATAGCAIDRGDLDQWPKVAQGAERLGAYAADVKRPPDLRHRAVLLLFEMNEMAMLIDVVTSAKGEDRAFLFDAYQDLVTIYLGGGHSEELKARAAGLGYHLMRYIDEVPAPSKLVGGIVDWCFDWLPRVEEPPGDVRLMSILEAAVVVRPDDARPRIVDFLRTINDRRVLLRVVHSLSQLRDATMHQRLAAALLDFARRGYPDVHLELAQAMVANGNETLLRFLIEAARDPRVPPATRNVGVGSAADRLKAKALDAYYRLLVSNDPATGNQFRVDAMELIWDYGGAGELATMLARLPDTGWPTEDGELKVQVDHFCDNRVARARDEVRPILAEALKSPVWITRLYAANCIARLYPDEAPGLLAPLAKDQTQIEGWSAEGPVSLGALISQLRDD